MTFSAFHQGSWTLPNNPAPRRGEIWIATDEPSSSRRHFVLIVSLDGRNQNDRIETVLVVPFTSRFSEGPTILELNPGESGLPDPSYLRGHYISVLKKLQLQERIGRLLSHRRMRKVCLRIRRAFDPDAPFEPK